MKRSVWPCSENTDHKKDIMKYFPIMTPGTKVLVLNPRLRECIGDSYTALITTSQPLVPISIHSPFVNLLPKPKTQNENYSYFNFVTKALQTGNATYIKNVGNEKSCDGSGNKNDPCGCISSANRANGIQADFYCPEFDLDRVEVPVINH